MSQKSRRAGGRSSRRVYDAGDAKVEEIEGAIELVGDDSVRSSKSGKPRAGNNQIEEGLSAASARSLPKGPKRAALAKDIIEMEPVLESDSEPAQQSDVQRKPGHALNGKLLVEKKTTVEDEYTLGHSKLCC